MGERLSDMTDEYSNAIFEDMFASGIRVVQRPDVFAGIEVTNEEYYQYLCERGYTEKEIEHEFDLKMENGRVYEI